MIASEDDMVIANRIIEEISGAIGMIFRFENDLCAAQVGLILVSDQFRFVAECS